MTRLKQAIELAKQTMIDFDSRWADKEFRIKVWKRMNPIEKRFWLAEMEAVAQQDLDHPYPL